MPGAVWSGEGPSPPPGPFPAQSREPFPQGEGEKVNVNLNLAREMFRLKQMSLSLREGLPRRGDLSNRPPGVTTRSRRRGGRHDMSPLQHGSAAEKGSGVRAACNASP